MSKHVEKYPGLYYGREGGPGMQYVTALNRVRKGMSVADALAMPVRRYGHIRPIPLTVAQRQIAHTARLMDKIPRQVAEALNPPPPWERVGYKRAEPHVIRKQIIAPHNDTSPARIQKLRADYCAHFIKFGTLDEGMAKQLKGYAHECRTAPKHPQRVSHEHAPSRHSSRPVTLGDDGRRVA